MKKKYIIFPILLLSVFYGCSKGELASKNTVGNSQEKSEPNKLSQVKDKKAGPNDDCVLYLKVFSGDDVPLGLCTYTLTETRGIFASTACVTVLVEGQSGVRHPFYGSKGHWGIEGPCEKNKVLEKLNEREIFTTVNPVSDLKMKRKAGKKVEIVKDDFGLATLLMEKTKP